MQDRALSSVAAVFVGGVVGTALRLAVDAAIPTAEGGFPLATLLINTLGSGALGLLAGAAVRAHEWVRAGLGAGVLGSFTTFSALTIAIVQLAATGATGVALLYLGSSLALGIAAAFAGMAAGARLLPGGAA